MTEKPRRARNHRLSDRERWRNLCDALAEDALRTPAPHSSQHFSRPTEEEWRKLCDYPSEAHAEPEDKPTRPIGTIPGLRVIPGVGPIWDFLSTPEGQKSEPAKEEPAPETETVKKTGPKKPGS